MKSIISLVLTSTIIASGMATAPPTEFDKEDEITIQEKTYSVNEFKKSNFLYKKYQKLVNEHNGFVVYNEDSFDEIASISQEPNLTVVDHSEEGETTAAILYDDINDDYYFLETSEDASNMFMALNNEEYVINSEDENISMQSKNGEELPLVETYFDEKYENKDFDWIIKETSEVTPYASWNLISSGKYYNSQNLTVTILSIVVSVVTSGVASGYLRINGIANSILGYIGIGWTVGQSLTQNYLIYTSQWSYSLCSVYYRTKYDYYVIPKSASGSTVTSTRDFYKYQYTINANPSSPPAGCAGFTNRTEGPYSYH